MKRMRKMIALLLVVTALLISALPVSAAVGGETAEPNVVVTKCDRCGGNIPKTPVRKNNVIYKRVYDSLNSNHVHEYIGDINVYTCSNCGKKYNELIRHDSISCSTWPHCLRDLPG